MQQFVWAHGYEWPGFGYANNDRALLVRWGQTVGNSFAVVVLGTVILFLVLASAILAVVWGPILMDDPASTSGITFFVGLGAACILSITVALPLSMLVAAVLTGRFAPAFAPADVEVEHGLRVYQTVLRQIRRVGIIGGILVPIGCFLMLVSTTFERVISTLSTTLP